MNFDELVGRIQTASDALKQDALVVINRSVTARAWLTGYYIVEYEQHGNDRAEYGTGLLKALAERLGQSGLGLASLKNSRAFYQIYPEMYLPVKDYLEDRFGKSQSAVGFLQLEGEGQKSQPAIDFLSHRKWRNRMIFKRFLPT